MLKKVKVNDIIKIVGRSYIPYEDRPVYLVLDLIEDDYKHDLFLLNENGETFWTNFIKKNKDSNVVIIN